MIPLYVDGIAAPVRILLDGPSLRLLRAGSADARYPLCRLTRLVVRGPVAWGDEALAACLAHGVPVSLLDRAGRHVGACLPTTPRAADTAALIDEAERAGVLARVLGDWQRAAERRAILTLLGRLQLAPRDLRPATVRGAMLRDLDASGPLPGHVLLDRLEALLDAEVCAQLLAEGIGPRLQGANPAIDLRRDLRGLLAWELGPLAYGLAGYLARHGAKHRRDGDLARCLARQFEGGRERRFVVMRQSLADLRRCLREALA